MVKSKETNTKQSPTKEKPKPEKPAAKNEKPAAKNEKPAAKSEKSAAKSAAKPATQVAATESCSSSIPSFVDIGKAAKDLFCKGFNFGHCVVDIKSKPAEELEVSVNGTFHHENGNIVGSVEGKKIWASNGLSALLKLKTDNSCAFEVTAENWLREGTKASGKAIYESLSGKFGGCLHLGYRNSIMNTGIDYDLSKSLIVSAAVFKIKSFLVGGRLTFDPTKCLMPTGSKFAIAAAMSDCTVTWTTNGFKEFHSTIYHKIQDNLEFGVERAWSSGCQDTCFAIGAKYLPDKDMTFKAKLNNHCQIGLSYEQKIHEAINVTLSAQIEGRQLSQACHKFGIGVDVEL